MRRWMTGMLVLALLLSGTGFGLGKSLAEEILIEEVTVPAGESVSAVEPVLVEDPENGRWSYAGPGLTISIERFSETTKIKGKNRTLEYCVADIQASPESPLYPVMSEPTKKRVAGYKLVSPELLQEKANPLFAMSDDMYGIRLQKYDYQGVVIRDGEVMATKTRNSAKKRPWPNLDTLALFADGSMKTYVSDALAAEDYLAMGAVQVFAFGPWLISGGELNPELETVVKYRDYNEPRVAIGMVAPWHYVAVVVRGRPTPAYRGVTVAWVANLLKERGCVEALNLDGGQTATLLFNGKIIETGGDGLRSQGSLICFGKIGE